MNMIKSLALALGLMSPALAATPPYQGVTLSTTTGKATSTVSGYFKVAASSVTASTPTVVMDGPSGGVDASSFTAKYGVKAATASLTATGDAIYGLTVSSGINVLAGGVKAPFFDGSLNGSKLVAGTVDTAALATDAVTAVKILNNTISTAKYAAGSVDTAALGTDAVTAAKILNATISTAKYAAGSVDTNALGTDAVTAVKILNATISTAKYATGSVDTNALGTDAVTTVKVINGAINTAKLATDAVGTANILNNAVTSAKTNGTSASCSGAQALAGATWTNGLPSGGTCQSVGGGGDMVLASTQTSTGAKVWQSSMTFGYQGVLTSTANYDAACVNTAWGCLVAISSANAQQSIWFYNLVATMTYTNKCRLVNNTGTSQVGAQFNLDTAGNYSALGYCTNNIAANPLQATSLTQIDLADASNTVNSGITMTTNQSFSTTQFAPSKITMFVDSMYPNTNVEGCRHVGYWSGSAAVTTLRIFSVSQTLTGMCELYAAPISQSRN